MLIALVVAPAASAQRIGQEFAAEPVRREIMAFYDSREEPRPDLTRIHRFAEMPLNYFGFVLTYWDINTGLAERRARRECPRHDHLVPPRPAELVLRLGAAAWSRAASAWW